MHAVYGAFVRALVRTSKSAFFALNSFLEFVTFATRHFKIEHQILDIETQLRKRLLDKTENPASSEDGFGHAIVTFEQFRLTLRVDTLKESAQFHKFRRQIPALSIPVSLWRIHHKGSFCLIFANDSDLAAT